MRRAIGRRMAHKCLVLLVVILSTSRALAGPLTDSSAASTQTCATLCPVNTKFAFDADQTYEYQYETDVKTSMGGASEDHSSLHLQATVQMEVISRCELMLRLSDVSLQDSDPSNIESRQQVERSNEFREALQARGLRFSFVDGHIEHICADQEEPVWALNIKRAILSTFQNTMESLDTDKRVFETDVAGVCPTEYENQGKSWSTRSVKKTKDLIGCINRNGPHSAFQGAPFQVPSDIQTLPIMKSTHECEQEINNAGILTKAVCKEMHVFRPFSRQENGAKSEVTSKLVFTRQVPGVSRQQSSVNSRSSLLFDHTLTPEERAENVRKAKQTLNDLCAMSENDIRPEVPQLFTKFVREARKLESDDLLRLFQVASKGICGKSEKFFRDAIPLIGTEASINLIRQLIEGGRATEDEADLWLTSISTSIHRPTKSMISALQPLLSSQPSRKSFLTVSSLINNYCSLNEGCDTDAEIQTIIHAFTERLNYNCRLDNQDDHDGILMSLKALGNTGHAERAIQTLARCASNQDLIMELRVAALQALRRMPCMADRSELFTLLENTENDSELRINTYLILMACPDMITLQRVVRLLETEPINQVGSFIWTHLTNLKETSSPHKQAIRAILENEELKKTFDLDKRKFSRNIEMSLFSEMLNMGGSVESNIIFSEQSYIPRSAMVNLTAELFGQSINFFELGGRLQGMEELLERFFGPGGEVNEIRQKRSVIRDDAINMLDRSYDAQRERMGASYFLRMFGNEIRYGDLHNFDLSNIKEKLNYLEWLIELANDHQFEVTKSMMFLDVTHVIPTVAGMPLTLEADGSAAINVQVSGKMDIRRMFTSPSTFDISGSVKPSAALEITSQMGIDAFVARTGLKMVTTLHTSTVAQGKFQLTEGKIFNMDWDIPQDKMEIISAESKFFITWRDNEREQRMLSTGERNSLSKCIGGKFTTVMGLELCGELSYPWDPTRTENVPFFPFTGPVSSKIFLNKRDTYTGFHFEAKYIQEKTRAPSVVQIKDIAKVQFNTPGSRVDRELSFEFEMDRANKQLEFKMKTPWKKADLSGQLVNTEALRSLTARATIDDQMVYSVTARLSSEDRRNAMRYTPEVIVVIPGREDIILDGSVTHVQSRKFDVDLQLKNLFQVPVTLKGSVDQLNNKRRMKYGGELELSSSYLNGRMEGFVDHNKPTAGQSFACRLTAEYTYRQGPQHRVVISNKIRDKSNNDQMSYSLDSAWRTTFWPRYDGEVSADFTYGANVLSTNIAAGLDDVRKVILSESATFNFGNNAATINGNARFQFPLKHIDYEVKLDHSHNVNELKTEGLIKYAENSQGSMTIQLERESQNPLKMSSQAKLIYPGREMAWTQSIEEKNPKEYHHDLQIQLQKYETIRLESVYKMIPIHDLSATLTIPEMEPMTLNARVNPDVGNLMVHLDTTVMSRTYMGEISSVIRGDFRPNFSLKNSLSLGWPGRQIEAETDISRRMSIVSFAGETSWDPNSKVTVNGQLTLDKTSPAAQLKVTWPQNFASIEFESAYKHQGWYTTEDDLQGKVRFTSSFPGFEDLSANLKHDMTVGGIKTEADFSWASNKKVDVDFTLNKINGYKKILSMVQIGTPYYGYRRMKGEVSYNLEGNTFQYDSKAEWESRVMEFTFTGEMNLASERLLTGTMVFKSPFPGFEAITASARHTDNGRQFNSQFETTWAPRQTISSQFQMNHMRNGYAIKNNGELMVTTPFSNYRQNKMSWTHENDDGKVNTKVQVECDSKSGMFDLDYVHRLSSSKRVVLIKSTLQTPFTYIEDIRINISHRHQRQSWQGIKTDASLQWAPSQSMTYEHEIEGGNGQLNMKSKFTSPFTDVITLDLNNQFRDAAYQMNNEIKYGSNKKITFESNGYFRGTTMRGTAKFSSPCPYLQQIILNVENKLENGIWMSHKDLEYAPGKKIILDTQLGYEAVKMVGINLKTPFHYVRELAFSTRLEGSLRNFESYSELEHNLLDRKMSLLLKTDTANLKRITGDLDFQSPFDVVRYIRASLFHFRNNGGKIQNKLSIEMPRYQGSIDNDMKIKGWDFHTTKTEIEYMPGQKIELSHEFSMEPKVQGTVIFKTPFDEMRTLSITFDHEGPATDFLSHGVIDYNGYQITGESSFKLEGTALTASAKVETSYNLMSIQLNHNGDYRQFTNNVAINFNGKQMTGSSEFALNDMEPTGKINIASPYDVIRSFNVEFAHTGKNWRNFENRGSVEYNGERYTAGSEFKWYGKTLRLKGKLNVPREYSIKINHRGEITDFNTAISITAAKEKIEFTPHFRLSDNLLDTSAVLATTFPGYENFELTIKHEGPASSFQTSANVVTPFAGYERMGAEVNHRLSGNNLNTVVRVNTPVREVPTIVVSLAHQGGIRDFSTVATAEYTSKKIEASTSFSMTNAVEGNFKLITPYQNAEKFIAGFKHEGALSSFKTSASIETPFRSYEKMLAEYTHRSSASGFNCNGRFESTIPNFQTWQLIINHNMPAVNSMESNIAVETSYPGYQRFAAEVNHRGNHITMRSSGSVDTPFSKFRRVSYTIDHDASNIRNIKSNLDLATPTGAFGAAVAYNGFPKHFQASAGVTTPFQGHNKYEISMDHSSRTLTSITNSAKLTTPMGEFGYALSHQGPLNHFTSSIEVTSPSSGHSRYAATLSHEGDSLTSIKTRAEVNTPKGDYSADLNHNGDHRSMNSHLEVKTPIPGYDRYRLNVDHSARDLSQIATSSQLTSPHGEFSISFTHSGVPRKFDTVITLTTPFQRYDRFNLNLKHDCSNARDISSSGRLSSSMGDFSYGLVFNGVPSSMSGSLTLTSPFSVDETFKAEFEHSSPSWTDISSRGSLTIPYGTSGYNVKHKGDLSKFQSSVVVNTPDSSFPRLFLSLDHASRNFKNIQSEANLELPVGNFGVKLNHRGPLRHLRSSLEVSTPFEGYKQMSAEINHNAKDLTDITSTSEFNTPWGTFGHSLTHAGSSDDFTSNLAFRTPFTGYETMSGKVQHNARDLSNIASTSEINTPWGKFKISLSHEGTSSHFTSSVTINTPFTGYETMMASVKHTGSDLTNIETATSIDTPWGRFEAGLDHKGPLSKFTTTVSVGTPFEGYRRMSASVRHTGSDMTNIETAVTLDTPWGPFGTSLTHRGPRSEFTSTVAVTTPFRGYERMSASLSHSGSSLRQFESSTELNTPWGQFTAGIQHNGNPSKFTSSISVSTPFNGYESMSASISHDSHDLARIQTTVAVTIPRGVYEMELKHDGQIHQFTSTLTIKTPHSGYERMSGSIGHTGSSWRRFKCSAQLSIPVGQFSTSVSHDGIPTKFTSTVTISTPYTGYERISASINNDCGDHTRIQSKATITIPRGEYELGLNHEGHAYQFTSTLSAKTPYPGYERMSASVSHSGRDLTNIHSGISSSIAGREYSVSFRHEGQATRFASSITVNSPHPGYERMVGSISLDARDLRNIASSLSAETPVGTYEASFQYEGTPLRFKTSLTINTPHREWRKMTFTLDNNTPDMYNMQSEAAAILPIGEYKYTFRHSGRAEEFNTQLTINTPHRGYDLDASINHAASSIFNIKSRAQIRTSKGTMGYNFDHEGKQQRFKSALTLSTPFSDYETMSATIEHNAQSLRRISSSLEVNYPRGTFKYNFNHNGRPESFTSTLTVNTPFRGYEQMTAELEHAASDLISIKTTGKLTIPRGTFSASLDHKGNLRKFISSIEVSTPIRGYSNYRLQINNDCESLYNMNTRVELNIPQGQFSTGVSYYGNPTKFVTSFNIATPFEAFRTFEITMDHAAADFSNIVSSISTKTPAGDFRLSLNHNGDLQRMRSSITLTTPFRRYENFGLNLDHEAASVRSIQTSLEGTSSMGNIRMTFNHRGTWKNFRSSFEMTTPCPTFDRFGAVVEHNAADLSDIKTGAQVNTPIGTYAYDLTFNGTPKRFTTVLEMTSPHQKFSMVKATTEVDVQSLNALSLSSKVDTPIGQYGFRLSHNGNKRNFRSEAEVTSPHTPYNKFGGALTFSMDSGISITGEITSSIPRFERMTLTLNHVGDLRNFRTSAETTSSIPGYSKFGATYTHASSMENRKSSLNIETPFQGHESYTLSLEKNGNMRELQANGQLQTPRGTYAGSYSHSGSLKDFRSEGSFTTPIRGYDRFGYEITHHGDGNRLNTNAQIITPFRNYERLGARLTHDMSNSQNIRSGLTISTTYPGLEEFVASLSHEGDLSNFNTDFQVTTPVEGYKTFGISLNHGGHIREFSSRGTINLPFRKVPSITVAVSHQGELTDFRTSGSIEYNNKKIESEAAFKKSSTRSGTSYDGTFSMNTPYDYLRSIMVTAVHTRNGDVKTGRLDVLHNGQQTVDFDYSYNTGSLKNVEIEIRQPYPMSSKVNVRGDRNDATFNWDTSRTDRQIRFDLDLTNEPAEKQISIRAALPSRTIGLTSTYNRADGRVNHGTEVMWDNTPETRASYNIDLSRSSRRSQNLYDGRFAFASPIGSMEATFNHICSPGRQYTTEVSVQHLTMKSDLVKSDRGFKHVLSAQHPRLPTNLALTTEGSYENKAVDGVVRLTFDAEEFAFTGHVADESSYSQALYNARAHLTHPGSHLDALWEGQYKDNSDSKVITMNGNYLTSYDRERKTATLRAEINKLRNSMDMEIITPVKSFTLTASETAHDAKRGIHNFEIVGTIEEHMIRGEFNINAEDKMVELKIFENSDDFLHMYAKMVTPTHAKAEIYTMVNGVRRQHAMASVAISDEQLISTRFFLNPTIKEEITSYVEELKRTTTYRQMNSHMENAIEAEFNRKSRQLARAVEPFQPVLQLAQQQATLISNKLRTAYQNAYRQNHFYIKDISDAFSKAAVYLKENIDLEQLNAVAEKIELLLSKLRGQWTSYVQKMVEFIVNTRPYWNKVVSTIKDTTLYVIDQVRNNKFAAWAWNKLMTIDIPDLIAPFETSRDSLMDKLEPYINRMKVWWTELEKQPEMQYIKAYVKRTMMKSVWFVRYMEFDGRVKEMLRELHHISLATYRSQLIQKIRDYLQLERTSWSVYNPEGGEIGFDLYWPFHWDDLKHLNRLRDINVQKYIDMTKEMIKEYTPEFSYDNDWSIYDIYYKYKPSTDYFNWIPPFKTYAAIMGSQHIMTFDKRFYEFAGECSYLLARDFIDGTFSVVVNYERKSRSPAKKSLTVMTNAKQVEVFNDGRVIVDGKRVELPLTFGNTTISRMGSMIRVDNTLGLTVDCNLFYDRCTVNVTGWYFSKTGGLFGTYNNEPADDFTTAENTRVTAPEVLADSWTAGQRCRPENYAVEVNPEPYTAAYKVCSKLFEEKTSQLRPCFKIVDPEPFKKMCHNDMPINVNREPSEVDACNSLAFYVDVCRREGVNVRVPTTCVRCEIEGLNTEITEGMNYTLSGESMPKSADVVFILQHAECNTDVLDKLKDVVDDLESTFKRSGITNNHYSVIGYGAQGSLNAPHMRTMDGQIFNTHDKFLLALDEFSRPAGESADALSAIYYASKLPFRAGVSKTLVLVPCSSCQEMTTSYADVEQVLMQKDIHLHMLMEHNFRLTVEKDPVSAYIFGTDNKRVFTRKDSNSKELEGDRELRQQLQMPKDLCTALAMESNGSIFNTLQWTQSRPYTQKRFVDVLVRLIAEKGQPKDCQKCDCVADEYGVGKMVCKTCQSTRSFYSFLPGFGLDSESSEETPDFSFEETEVTTRSPKRLRMLKRRQRQQRT